MKTAIDARLCEEAARYELRHGCENCAHFEPETTRCAHGYPNQAHLRVRLEPGSSLEFCKEFELY